ncbi:MAG: GGDEF domain-containing protein [Colwellia sp.]|nr:GGDEF domain-containing protein [Colwellia sp.]NQZ81404.1 GGDEF domain-containing protein [Colwellia sp.]
MVNLSLRILMLFTALYWSQPVFAVSDIEEIINIVEERDDFYETCLYGDIEADIEGYLKDTKNLSYNQHAYLLYVKSNIYHCKGQYGLEHEAQKKITIFPEDEIDPNIYLAALHSVGNELFIYNYENACEYNTSAKLRITNKTPFALTFMLTKVEITSCHKNNQVEKLRKLYRLLETLNDDKNKKYKVDILETMANEYAFIGQNSTAAKLRQEAMTLMPLKEKSMESFTSYYNLGTDYLDAGDIKSAEKIVPLLLKEGLHFKGNLMADGLSYIYQAKIAYEKRDYPVLISLMDELSPLIPDLEIEYNTKRISTLRALACIEAKREVCVSSFIEDVNKDPNSYSADDIWLLTFLTKYYIEKGDSLKAKMFFDKYLDKNRAILLEQQVSSMVIGSAQLYQNIVEMELSLARNDLKSSRLVIMLIVAILAVFMLLALLFWQLKNRHKHLAETDELSNISNRRAMLQTLSRIQLPSQGKHHVIALIDLDKFKSVNDNYGHAIGDEVIKHAVKITLENIRQQDVFGRIGGEEFLLCLKDISSDKAKEILERIRYSMEHSCVVIDNGNEVSITASFSYTEFNKAISSFTDIYQKLDRGLYAAKDAGRNIIIKV